MSYIGSTPTTQSFIAGTDYFNGDGSTVAFTLSRSVVSVNDIEVVINNVEQQPSTAYTVSGTTITFTSAPSAGTANIYVRYLSTTTQSITPSQNTVSYSTLNSDNQSKLGISFKNRIINGAMVIDQRNAGASVTTGYPVDRWQTYQSTTSKYTFQQNQGSITPPVGFVNYLGSTVASAYSATAADAFILYQWIEGYNIADFNFGSANATTVTVSFWVRSSLTGTHSGSLVNNAQDRSFPFTFTVNAANTWEKKSITIVGCPDGTWLTTNGQGLAVIFNLGCGSNFLATAGAWTNSSKYGVTGSVNIVATAGATFYVTGVQLEAGTQATTFDYRSYPTELAMCQRYYETSITGTAVANQVTAPSRMVATSFTSTSLNQNISFKVTKRSVPTITTYTASGLPGTGFFDAYIGGVWVTGTLNGITAYFNSFDIDFNVAPATTPNSSYITAGNWAASSEF